MVELLGPDDSVRGRPARRGRRHRHVDDDPRRPGAGPAVPRRLHRRPGGLGGLPPLHRAEPARGQAGGAADGAGDAGRAGRAHRAHARAGRGLAAGPQRHPAGAGGAPRGDRGAGRAGRAARGRRPPAGAVLGLRPADLSAGDAGPGPVDRTRRLCVVLEIDQATYDAIVAHARRDHPDEACGVVAGPAGSDRPARFVPMLNAARSPTFYEFDSHDLLRALPRDGRARRGAGGDLPLAHGDRGLPVPHGHRAGAWSRARTTCSSRPVSPTSVEFRSYRIVDGEVTEEEVRVLAAL